MIPKRISGFPIGHTGDIRYWLCTHVLDEVAATATIVDGMIFQGNMPLASYRYFDQLEEPLFNFVSNKYKVQHLQSDDSRKVNFRLSMGSFSTPRLWINSTIMTNELVKVITDVMLSMAGKMLVNTSDSGEGNYAYDFWCSADIAAKAVASIAETYVVPDFDSEAGTRVYQAAWNKDEVRYIGPGGDTYMVKTKKKTEVIKHGTVEIQGDVIKAFHFSEGGKHAFRANSTQRPQKVGEGN